MPPNRTTDVVRAAIARLDSQLARAPARAARLAHQATVKMNMASRQARRRMLVTKLIERFHAVGALHD